MKINRISNLNNIQQICKTTSHATSPIKIEAPKENIAFSASWVPSGTALVKITGSFSKQDCVEVEKIFHKFQHLPTNELFEQKIKIIKEYQDLLKKSGINFKIENGQELCEYDSNLVTNKLQRALKQFTPKIFALNKLILANTQALEGTYTPWFETSFNKNSLQLSQSLYEHPVDKVLRIVGDFTKENSRVLKNKENQYNSLGIYEIFEKKKTLLDKIAKYFENHKSDFVGSYSAMDFFNLKVWAIEYTALNNAQKQRGIFTKDLERIYFSPQIPQEIQKGDYIDGLGLITDRMPVDKNDAIIVFSEIEKSNMFRMYNLGEIRKKDELKNKISSIKNIKEFMELNQAAKELIRNEEKNIMAEIRFMKTPAQTITKIPTQNQEIAKLAKEFSHVYYIRDFLNYDSQKYPDAAKTTGARLLRLLNEKDCYPVYLKALPYHGSKHSPARFYMRYGFKPFSHTDEELNKIIADNNGKCPADMPVYFYLKDFTEINPRLENWLKMYNV